VRGPAVSGKTYIILIGNKTSLASRARKCFQESKEDGKKKKFIKEEELVKAAVEKL